MTQYPPLPDTPKIGSAPPTVAAVTWADTARAARFEAWLAPLVAAHALNAASLRPASADASFRRYLRIDTFADTPTPGGAPTSLVIMDAPPDKEDSAPFVKVTQLMQTAGVRVPDILAWDAANGFMLLSDLGTHTLMQVTDPAAPPPLERYLQATDILVQWQKASMPGVLPPYDQALLLREMELFPQWYVAQHRKHTLDSAQRKTLDDAFACIVENNLRWPCVWVHRDFMPRNLMVSAQGLGVLDFQDAVYGPVTYDIASLMRDAFLTWDEEFCLDVTIRYWEKARKVGLPVGDDFGEFWRGVEWMGLQRHLKVAGIFARLTLRDGKPQYLADTPRFIAYIRNTCERYRELKPLLRLIDRIEGTEAPPVFVFGRG